MQNFIEFRSWALLLKASWQAAVLIVLVLAVQYALGRRLSPRWRSALWLLVVLRLALPWTIPSAVSLFNFLSFSRASEAVVSLRAIPRAPGAVAVQPTAFAPAERTAPPTAPLAAVASAAGPGFRMDLAWLPLGWAAGALGLALGLAITHCRLSRRITPCRPLIDARVLNLLEDCKHLMGVRAPVALVESAAVDGPCLFGCLRPRLVLPPGFTRGFSLDELRYVFLHELGHVKRHDIALGWLMAWLQILHWFNPLVWLAFSRMRADRELACDALALSHAGEQANKPYGRTILKLLENFGDALRAPGLAGIVEDKQQIKERINMIAQFHKTNRGPVLAGLLFIGLGLLTLTDAQTGSNGKATETAQVGDNSEEQQHLEKAQAGNKWAAYWLWDSYYRGNNGVTADAAKADKWLREFVQNVWVVKFEPTNDFAPAGPGEFLERINQHAQTYSGNTNIGIASFFRTTKQGDKLVGSFLSNYPDQLKDSLAKVPGLKVTSADQITPETFIEYEKSPQESLAKGTGETEKSEAAAKSEEQKKMEMAQAGNKWAAYWLWDSYHRGNNSITPDPAKADKWLREFVQDVWLVKFEPINDFAPAGPHEFLERINQYAQTFSGQTQIGIASFFRTIKQGDKLVGSFLSNYPDQLKANLAKVPDLKVTTVEKITPEKFLEYEKSTQESL